MVMEPRTFWREVTGLLIDMDGVLYRGKMTLPGAATFIHALQSRDIPYLYLTNNASRTPAMYVAHLAKMGIDAEAGQFMTSALATSAFLQAEKPGATVFIVGEIGISEALRNAGFTLLPLAAGRDAEVVVSSFDRQLTYAKLREASLAIERGALFVQTNPDLNIPMPDGLHPGAGAIAATLIATTNRYPVIMGKPQPEIFRQALARLNTLPEQTFMIGDRLETDIVGAQRMGLRSVMVETGTSSREEALRSPSPPDLIVPDLTTLLSALD